MTAEQMKENGFFKVGQDGGTFVVGYFWNPDTKELISKCVRDYDYADCSRDNDSLYYMEIDEDIRRDWLHHNGIILVGDTVEVFKGRKVPIGYTGLVTKVYDWRDRYGRVQATYAILDYTFKTNINNCRRIEE